MISLLPTGSTRLERALEQVALGLLEIPTPIRAAWSAQHCPEPLLPWLAWGLSIDNWASDWPVAVKRARVASAIPIARRKGTASAVRSVVESFGGNVAIREWWQMTPRGTPHTFELALNLGLPGAPVSAAFADQVIEAVHRVKPVRSHFIFTQGHSASGAVGMIGAARPAIFARLSFAA